MTTSTAVLDRHAAMDFLFGRIDYERTASIPYRTNEFRLRRMRELLERLGNPQRNLPAIHVAGTKGKGSTSTMIAAVLSRAGHRTGLYTSPHLERLEERFVIDGQCCGDADFVELVAGLMPVVEQMDRAASGEGRRGPTFFEITTAMAMVYFARRRVDAAVFEVGLGGRLDSTNTCCPVATVITSISFDHVHQLGHTLAAIAGEKAGIIKPGVPVISGVEQPEPRAVVADVARRNGCRLLTLGEDFQGHYELASRAVTNQSPALTAPRVVNYREMSASGWRMEDLSLGFVGAHQARNAAVALATLGELRRMGWDISEPAIRAGLAQARCPARIEIVSHDPIVVIDTAHNVASVEALRTTLLDEFPPCRRLLMFGTSKDKDAAGMLQLLLPHFDQIVLTRYVNNPRGVPPEQLLAIARELAEQLSGTTPAAPQLSVASDPPAAWQRLISLATPDALVCVAGSTFLAAEVRPLALSAC